MSGKPLAKMSLLDAYAIIMMYNEGEGFARKDLAAVNEAHRLIREHALAVLGNRNDDQDPEC